MFSIEYFECTRARVFYLDNKSNLKSIRFLCMHGFSSSMGFMHSIPHRSIVLYRFFMFDTQVVLM